ncbi:hypothetical protein C0Q70_17783 [Pomacea canaliculata]|uniref:RING-type domain-containing protein n=1 Tax=Pomacea canaliculata TaxID=400727 RepID=A0A2T7NLD5_POMCA|nr:hypothetical protein C0Q70_17783 [Pomacea canaliculata]
MATTSRDHEPQETECPVCNNSFVLPKILPCGHVFCRTCVISLINARKQPECPMCRSAFADPAKQGENIADALPTDEALNSLATVVNILTQEHECHACDGVKAESICSQCLVKLCAACTRAHKKLPVTRNHEVESLTAVTAERLAASGPGLCPQHDQQISYFCSDDNLAVCASCCILDHKACRRIIRLDSEMKSSKKEILNLEDKLTKAEAKIEETINHLDMRLKESTHCQSLMDTARENLIKFCKREEEKSRNFQEVVRSVQKVRLKLRERLARVKSHKRIVSRAGAVCPRPGLVYAKRALQDRVNTLDLSDTLPEDVNVKALFRHADYSDFVRQITNQLPRQLDQQSKKHEKPGFTFHTNRGSSVVLTNNGKWAESVGPGGIVVSSGPLETNVMYQIMLVALVQEGNTFGRMVYGVTATHPDKLHIKKTIEDMKELSPVRPSLPRMKKYNTLGLVLDSMNNIHTFSNGVEMVISIKDVPRPCYAVFDLGCDVRKVGSFIT